MVKFVNSLSRLRGERGQRPGGGSAANGDAALGGLRSLAAYGRSPDDGDEASRCAVDDASVAASLTGLGAVEDNRISDKRSC